LHRYSGQTDIAVGSPIAGRNRAETEGLIGFFVNTLVLRTDLSGNPTFRELLGRVRETALGAYAHQDLPFEHLVADLQPVRDLSRSPLFQVLFVLQNVPLPTVPFADLKLSPLAVETGTAKFDLNLTVEETGHGLQGALTYNTDLFEAATITRLLGHFHTMLEGIVADPKRRLGELPLLTEAEQQQVLLEWNDTRTDWPRTECIHQLIEAQAERTPNAVAVVFEDQKLTYAELNQRANQLAHWLRAQGVGPEVVVGICLERSLEMVVGLLGVLKAGGAYLPLDPASPQERLAGILEDAQTAAVVTRAGLQPVLPPQAGPVICLDTPLPEAVGGSSPANINLASTANINNAAYLLYTSGSTGRPKGVVVEHRQIVNYLHGIVTRLGIVPGATFAMVQPLTVDSCKTVLFGALCTGGCLHVISESRALDSQLLADYLRRHRIDGLKIAPSHLAALMSGAHPEQLLPRRWLILGGEASRWDWVRELQGLAPQCTIYNHYGPTEATVGMLTYRAAPNQDDPSPALVPLGQPLPNTRAYVLDRYRQPVPVGIPGELYIGGDCVARGYWRLPELTTEQFIADWFKPEPGARLYRTGDRVRLRPDGHLEFLGRLDHQVKVRGFRIELGEIEAALAKHPAVHEVVVVAWGEGSEDKRLVAYVVAKEELASPGEQLRNYLKAKLPEFMVPSAYVVLAELPRTAHGKLDRRALPAPALARPELPNALAAPRTPVEHVVADVWAELLGITPIDIHANFFEVGGHSLLATRVIARLRDALGVDLPVRALFEAPTVTGLAAAIVQRLAETVAHEEMDSMLAEIEGLSPNPAMEPRRAMDGDAWTTPRTQTVYQAEQANA